MKDSKLRGPFKHAHNLTEPLQLLAREMSESFSVESFMFEFDLIIKMFFQLQNASRAFNVLTDAQMSFIKHT